MLRSDESPAGWRLVAIWVGALVLGANVAAGCGGSSSDGGPSGEEDCRYVGRYAVGKEGGYQPCCEGLNEISTLMPSYGPSGEVSDCQSVELNTYACILGTCGDGICEPTEEGCGCIRDCGGPSECNRAVAQPERPPPPTVERRTTASTCERSRPCNSVEQPGEVCGSHAECRDGVNGRCQLFGNECTYDDCFNDADCGPGQLCDCNGGLNGSHRCVAAACRTDADCSGGFGCSPTRAPECTNLSSTVGYHCRTSRDECTEDSDCPDSTYCIFANDAWRCAGSTCITR